jgi:hypothetical protein
MIRRHATAVVCAVLLFAGVAHAGPTAEQKCQAAKWKEQAKVEACLKKNTAKLVGGASDASAKCWAKFQAGLVKADGKAAAAGTACRYVDNGDGTVSDLNTGLLWEQKTNADGVANLGDAHDADNVYSLSASGTALDGTAYTAFLAALNSGASADGAAGTAITGCFAGHCDWRLPSIVELQAIVDPAMCAASSCLDAAFGPRPAYVYYWSATSVGADPTTAWDIKFSGSGALFTWAKINDNWVRAVRGGLSSAPPAGSVATPTSAPTAVPTATPTGGATAVPTPTPQCATAIDCPATGNECVVATCNANVCGTQNLGNAHVLSTGQTTGDCQQLVCNGAGGVVSIDAASDLPTSSTVCLIAPACSGPAPLHPTFTALPAGTDCSADNEPPNHICGSGLSEGVCVECNNNADCGGGQTCQFNMCF